MIGTRLGSGGFATQITMELADDITEMEMDILQSSRDGLKNSGTKQLRDRLGRWLFALMAHVPAPNNETQASQKSKVFLYCEALLDRTELATETTLKLALLRFKFFPTVSELTEFFDECEQNDPDWKPPVATEFEPPNDLAGMFNAWKSAIGAAAYRSWLRGCEAWRNPDGGIHIKTPDAVKATWIREHYLSSLENIAQVPVLVMSEDRKPVRNWPHKGPLSTTDAWWQTNERWKNDNASGFTQVFEGWKIDD